MNIRELAKEAGVSVATISRVINHPEAVLPETRERVQAIIEKYNWRPRGFWSTWWSSLPFREE